MVHRQIRGLSEPTERPLSQALKSYPVIHRLTGKEAISKPDGFEFLGCPIWLPRMVFTSTSYGCWLASSPTTFTLIRRSALPALRPRKGSYSGFSVWWTRQEFNLRPSECKSDTLATELRAHTSAYVLRKLELTSSLWLPQLATIEHLRSNNP